MIMKKIFLVLGFLTVCIAFAFLPYRAWLESRLEVLIEKKGFENVELTISSLGLKSASLENISLGANEKINLKNILFDYSLADLWKGNLQNLSVSGITINVKQQEGRWVVVGLEDWKSKTSEPLAFPVTSEDIAQIPFAKMKIEDSTLNVLLEKGKLALPLNFTWEKVPQSEFNYQGNDIAFSLNALEFIAGNLTLNAYIPEQANKWTGLWMLENLTITGASIPVPVMHGKGSLSIEYSKGQAQGSFLSDDKLWSADFSLEHDLKAAKTNIAIIQAHMPWKEGRIDIRDVKVPLQGKDPIKVVLQIQSVSIEELMQSLTGDRVSATGKVSGTLPILIARDGKITVLPGKLKSEEPGTISMPPDVIPGDNEQVSLVRQILEDLQYTDFSITTTNDDAGRLNVLMTFEGNNPAVYEGRPVKLNVNLTGDVLEFIEQNILLLTTPEKLLKQGSE
jgi:hypothetical protein